MLVLQTLNTLLDLQNPRIILRIVENPFAERNLDLEILPLFVVLVAFYREKPGSVRRENAVLEGRVDLEVVILSG